MKDRISIRLSADLPGTFPAEKPLASYHPAGVKSFSPYLSQDGVRPGVFTPAVASSFYTGVTAHLSRRLLDVAGQESNYCDLSQSIIQSLGCLGSGCKKIEMYPAPVPHHGIGSALQYRIPKLHSHDQLYPSLTSFAVSSQSAFELWLLAHYKLNYYQHLRQEIRTDIAFIKSEYLYDGSSAVIREQHKKLTVVEQVIGEFKSISAIPWDYEYVSAAAAAEHVLASLGSVSLLDLERAHVFADSVWDRMVAEPSPTMRPLFHAFLRLGRTKRNFARRPVRDKRRYFRTLVRILFKQMDDQSGHDEFLVISQSVVVRNLSSTEIGSFHEHKRHYRAARAHSPGALHH